MNVTRAYAELDAVRNDRSSSTEQLLARIDAVGAWAAKQKTSRNVMQLLKEASELHQHVSGNRGYRAGAVQVRFEG